MTPEENYRNWRKYEVTHANNPISPDLYGVVDELSVAKISGNKELQEKIEKGEFNRYSPSEFNDSRKKTKKEKEKLNYRGGMQKKLIENGKNIYSNKT